VHRDSTPTVYKASFNDNVQVVQNGRQLALADVMHVNFLSDEKRSSSASQPAQSSTAPATEPATARAGAGTGAGGAGGAGGAKGGEASGQKRKSSKEAAATKPSDGPITIKWTGKLRVVPIEAPATRPTNLAPGKPEVQFVGNPVTLMQDRGKVVCGQASYNSGEGSADLRGSDSAPLVHMTADTGMEVLTPHMVYSEASPKLKYATLVGPSSAKLPVDRGPGKDPFVNTKWTEQCKLRMVSDEQNRTYIEHADITGGVVVDDADMNMTSDRMQLAFIADPPKARAAATQLGAAATAPSTATAGPVATALPATSPLSTEPSPQPAEQVLNVQPSEIIAEGNVMAKLRDDQQREQTIAGNRLTLNTEMGADGKRFARRFEVDGNVHSVNRQGELTSEHLLALLKPSTRPTEKSGEKTAEKTAEKKSGAGSQFGGGDMDLESLVADRNVRFATTQGAVATAHPRIPSAMTIPPAKVTVGNPKRR